MRKVDNVFNKELRKPFPVSNDIKPSLDMDVDYAVS